MKDNANSDINFNYDTSTKAFNLYKSCYNFEECLILKKHFIIHFTNNKITSKDI